MTPRSTRSVLGPTVRLALVSALFSILVPATAQDQGFLCGNNNYSRLGHLVNGHPERVAEIEQAREELEAWTAHYHEDADRGGDDYIIPWSSTSFTTTAWRTSAMPKWRTPSD
jgi:hypothetical protein